MTDHTGLGFQMDDSGDENPENAALSMTEELQSICNNMIMKEGVNSIIEHVRPVKPPPPKPAGKSI